MKGQIINGTDIENCGAYGRSRHPPATAYLEQAQTVDERGRQDRPGSCPGYVC
jgi:hypothetical protein